SGKNDLTFLSFVKEVYPDFFLAGLPVFSPDGPRKAKKAGKLCGFPASVPVSGFFAVCRSQQYLELLQTSESQQRNFQNTVDPADLVQGLIVDILVDAHECYSFLALLVPAPLHGCYIYACVAKDHSDTSDHTGLVDVLDGYDVRSRLK